jgi:hypothetical protein
MTEKQPAKQPDVSLEEDDAFEDFPSEGARACWQSCMTDLLPFQSSETNHSLPQSTRNPRLKNKTSSYGKRTGTMRM